MYFFEDLLGNGRWRWDSVYKIVGIAMKPVGQ